MRGMRSRRLVWCLAGVLAAGRPAMASPHVALDHPVYDRLDELELAGALPAFRGGLAPLTRARIHELVADAPAVPGGWWIAPVERAALRLDLIDDASRDYTTAVRPRTVAGRLALSCEGQEGRRCGSAGLSGELDVAAGYGTWVAGAARLQAGTGLDGRDRELGVDRAYLSVELGPIAAEVGRDVVALGPAAPTRLGWGTSAPPLDHVRLSGARPLALSGRAGANLVYVLGRLAAPQSHPGALVSIARAQLDVGRLELGAMQLLQLGGEGAPGFTPWGFVLEHVRRRDITAGPSDSSNRRMGIDVAARIAGLGGARLTYQLLAEDLRKRFDHALRHDADHALGLQTRWLTVQWRRTGVRAYEHMPRVTGFTSGGRIVGDPLGPAAQAVFASARLPVGDRVVQPWVEAARLASDTYAFVVSGPIRKTADGPAELRFRLGVRARVPLGHSLELDAEVAFEHVERASFVPGARREGALLRAALVWRPELTLGYP
jgi:hypothetical protein